MPKQAFLDLVLLMDHKPEAIGETIKEALKQLREDPKDLIEAKVDPIAYFVNEIVIVMLNLMGEGKIDELRDLLSHINLALNAEADNKHLLYSLSPNDHVSVRLMGIAHTLAIYLRTDNVARLMAEISTSKNFECRRTLRWIYHHTVYRDRPVRARSLYWLTYSSAGKILRKLTALGLLERTKEGRVFHYFMTWTGRRIGGVLNEANDVELDISYE